MGRPQGRVGTAANGSTGSSHGQHSAPAIGIGAHGPDPPISQDRLQSEMYADARVQFLKDYMGQIQTQFVPFGHITAPSSPKVVTAKGRTGSRGHADQPSLTGPMAHPGEVIQEAWHCFAQNKAKTMSNNILILVKVNSVWGIVFSMTSLGTGLVINLGFNACGQGPPLPNLTATRYPTEAQVYPQRHPTSTESTCQAQVQPSTYRCIYFSSSLTDPPLSQIRKLRLREEEDLAQVTQLRGGVPAFAPKS